MLIKLIESLKFQKEEASHDQTFGARGRNFAGMSSGGSVATAVKIAEELDSGVIVAVTVAIGIYLQIYSISVNRLYKQLYLYFNFRKVSCLRKTILYVITMEDN
jgi:hypothetical protein